MKKKWVACEVEEEFFGDDRKLNKQEKKRLQTRDRSKYKKTDLGKQTQKPSKEGEEGLLKGRILTIAAQDIRVDVERKIYSCSMRGILKKEKTLNKNLLTVGDFVLLKETAPLEGVIEEVLPRTSVLSRADNLSRRKQQLIAANVDIVLITTSVVMPQLKPPLVDRYIIAASKGGMQPIIVVNKVDLLNSGEPQAENEKELLEIFKQGYKQIGIPVIEVSATTGQGIEELKMAIKDKISVFSGQSGVGKSSLINTIANLDLRIGDTVERTKKGAHTTTSTQLLPLEFGGYCVDTPGIKSFGVWDLKIGEIENYFSEIHEIGENCRYPDCSHSGEEGCAVLEAIEEGQLSPIRYQSYQALRESVGEDYLRR